MARDLKELLFRRAKNARMEALEHGEHSSIGMTAARTWEVFGNLLEDAGLMGEFHDYESGSNDVKGRDQRLKSVTMTKAQWDSLRIYLIMSSSHREGERDAWLRLSQEKNADGTPRFQHAADNAAYWQEVIDDLKTIENILGS